MGIFKTSEKVWKVFASWILSEEIRENEKRIKYLNSYIANLEDAIVDGDKKVLIQAFYNVALRRDKEIKLDFGTREKLMETPFEVWNIPISLSLVDKIIK